MRGVGLALLLAGAAPAIAAAHVKMAPMSGEPGGAYEGAVVVSHGCKGSPTRSVSIVFPKALAVHAAAPAGWSVETKDVPEGVSVSWTGRAEAHTAVSLPVSMTLPPERGALYLVVNQTCVVGAESWSQIPAPGQDPHGLPNPAAMIAVGVAPPLDPTLAPQMKGGMTMKLPMAIGLPAGPQSHPNP